MANARSEFIVLPGLPAHAGLVAPEGDPLARVIVGHAGAGKSEFLLELRERLERADTCDLTRPDIGPPSLAHVTRVAETIDLGPAAERVEIWRKLWERAIMRAVVAELLSGPFASTEVRVALAEGVKEHRAELLVTRDTPSSISREFDRVLREHQSLPELRQFLDHAGWHDVDHAVAQALGNHGRPLCYFLDIVQEDSARTPLYWQWCMRGLLEQLLRFGREPFPEDKLRIFVTVRDQTWIEVRDLAPGPAEHHPNVRLLHWDAPTLLDFFAAKIRQLPPQCSLGEIDGDDTAEEVVANWLGTPTVSNRVRPVEEPLGRYVLRHTRLIPRDIVGAGNFLAEEVHAARRRGEDAVAGERIRAAVGNSARTAAWEELRWCALEVISAWLLGAESNPDRNEILSDEDPGGGVARALGNLLGSCSADIVEDEELDELETEAYEYFGRPLELRPLLWRHGLIGIGSSSEGPFRFAYDLGLVGSHEQPPAGTHIAMHPALIDAVGVAAAGDRPVYPFAEDPP